MSRNSELEDVCSSDNSELSEIEDRIVNVLKKKKNSKKNEKYIRALSKDESESESESTSKSKTKVTRATYLNRFLLKDEHYTFSDPWKSEESPKVFSDYYVSRARCHFLGNIVKMLSYKHKQELKFFEKSDSFLFWQIVKGTFLDCHLVFMSLKEIVILRNGEYCHYDDISRCNYGCSLGDGIWDSCRARYWTVDGRFIGCYGASFYHKQYFFY
jgi:hypothetical protein